MTVALEQISAQAADILNESIVCDLCLPWTAENAHAREGFLESYAAAGGTFSSLTVTFGKFTNFEGTVRHLAAELGRIAKSSEKFRQVHTAQDIRQAKKDGKLGLAFNLQGCDALSGDLAMVEAYYRLGVRQMLLCYNVKNLAGDGCHEITDCGLSQFGRDLVREMNRVGMIVDCTHTGYRTSMDMMEVSQDPVIFSHSNAKAVHAHERNIADDQIRACAATGGLVGVVGLGPLVGENVTIDALLDHVDHMLEVAGPDHVAIGFDAVYTPEITYRRFSQNPGSYPDYPNPPWNFIMPQDVPAVAEGMVRRGYGSDTIKKILGENFLRVAEKVWR